MEKIVREKGDSCPSQADTPHPSSQGGAQTGRQRAPAHSQHPGGANTGFIQQWSLITQLKGFCVTFPSPSSLGHRLQGLTPSHRGLETASDSTPQPHWAWKKARELPHTLHIQAQHSNPALLHAPETVCPTALRLRQGGLKSQTPTSTTAPVS